MNEYEILKEFIEWKNKPRMRISNVGIPESKVKFGATLTNDPVEIEKKIGCEHCKSWLVDNLEMARKSLDLIYDDLYDDYYKNPIDDLVLKKNIDIKSKIYVFAYLEQPKVKKQQKK